MASHKNITLNLFGNLGKKSNKMKKIKIKDTSFQHCKFSNNPTPPVSFCEHFEWDWDTSVVGKDELIFYTHDNIMDGVNDTKGKKVCWLIEPLELVNVNYEQIKKYYDYFEYVFTYEKTLLDLGKNFRFIPSGGCWIESDKQQIHNKTKLVSIIASFKKQLEGHKLRHDVISNYGNKMDVLGNGYRPIPKKIDGLKDYMFSVIIENCKRDYYFTEKLIDCLITGTVPVYWGCPSIGDFFNKKGFIVVDSVNDVGEALSKITPELYQQMLPYIEDNFNKSKNYILSENYIFDEYIKKNKLYINE